MNQKIANIVEELAEEIHEGTQNFYRGTLTHLVAYKCFLGRKLTNTDDSVVEAVAEKVGISETLLFDAQKMYRTEKLTPKTEAKFIKEFVENYSSWNAYKKEKLYLAESTDGVQPECKHKCSIHN